MRPRLADRPEPGDAVVEREGLRIFVAPELAQGRVTLDASPEHNTLVVRWGESEE